MGFIDQAFAIVNLATRRAAVLMLQYADRTDTCLMVAAPLEMHKATLHFAQKNSDLYSAHC